MCGAFDFHLCHGHSPLRESRNVGNLCSKRGITNVGNKQLKEFRKSLKRVKAANAGTRAGARKFLQKEGVHTPSGKLTSQYR